MTKSQEVRFEISTVCPYKCQMCPRSRMTRGQTVMGDYQFLGLLTKIQRESKDQFRVCDFSGMGEPLVDPHLENKIETAKGYKMKTIVISNGYYLTPDRFISLQRAGLDYLRISFHATTMEEYGIKHGIPKEFYAILCWNLKEVMRGPRHTKIGIHYTLEDPKDETIAEIKDRWQAADVLEIWRPHNWADAFKYRKAEPARPCSRIESGPLQIQIDGSVNACCFDYDGKTTAGSLVKESLREIYKKMKYTEICIDCDQRNLDRSQALIYSSVNGPDRTDRTSSGFIKL